MACIWGRVLLCGMHLWPSTILWHVFRRSERKGFFLSVSPFCLLIAFYGFTIFWNATTRNIIGMHHCTIPDKCLSLPSQRNVTPFGLFGSPAAWGFWGGPAYTRIFCRSLFQAFLRALQTGACSQHYAVQIFWSLPGWGFSESFIAWVLGSFPTHTFLGYLHPGVFSECFWF